MDQSEIADITEIEQLLARYAIGMTRDDIDAVIDVFTPDGTYSAFGDTYALSDFPALVRAAPKGLFLTGTPVLELEGDTGTGQQTLCFVDQTTHDMRIGYYTDTYQRTAQGWRLHTRAMTFLRRSGARDSGKAARPHPARAFGGRGRLTAGAVELDAFKAAVDDWLDEHAGELAPSFEGIGTLDDQMAQLRKVMRLTYDADFMRMGWPERVGGLGGSNLLRAYLGEVLTARDLVEPGIYSMPEVLAPTMIDYAPEALAAAMVPRLLRGEEIWCQGFSEPGTGSNLASLACRATRDGDSWRINGQKVWTSLAQYAQRCVLLTRTGTPESAHKGITALFVDMDSAGITVRPIETMHGAREFCEVFFDDVLVPGDRVLGEVDRGWSIAMDLLPYERSTALWHRAAYLQRRLEQLLAIAPAGALDPTARRRGHPAVVGVPRPLTGDAAQARGRRDAGSRDLGRQGARGDGRADGLRPGGRGARRGHRARGRPGQPALAGRVPLLPRRHHLRGQRRGAAQHHRPPPARPRGRPLMEAAERALFESGVRHATEAASGAALDAALDDLGWADALDADRAHRGVRPLRIPRGGARHLGRARPVAGRRPGSRDRSAPPSSCPRCGRATHRDASTAANGASSRDWAPTHSGAPTRRSWWPRPRRGSRRSPWRPRRSSAGRCAASTPRWDSSR